MKGSSLSTRLGKFFARWSKLDTFAFDAARIWIIGHVCSGQAFDTSGAMDAKPMAADTRTIPLSIKTELPRVNVAKLLHACFP